jgi:hypothetical protein
MPLLVLEVILNKGFLPQLLVNVTTSLVVANATAASNIVNINVLRIAPPVKFLFWQK